MLHFSARQVATGCWLAAAAVVFGSEPPVFVVPLLLEKCADCHGEEKQKGKFVLHDIDADFTAGADIERWEKILEMVSIGDMPPEDEPQLTAEQTDSLLSWLTTELQKIGRGPEPGAEAFPKFGNRIDHDALFSGEHQGPAFTQSRVWRISPYIYQQFAKDTEMPRQLTAPLMEADPEGFRDFSLLYADEATIKTMLQNAKRIAKTMIHGRFTINRTGNSRNVPKHRPSRHTVFLEFASAAADPDRAEMETVVNYAFEFLLHRSPNPDELERYVGEFLEPNIAIGGRDAALQGTLSALMLSPEFLFRMELGLGETMPDGRRRLSSTEIAYALSFAVFDYLDPTLVNAAEAGELETKEDIAREFRRVLTSPDRRVRGSAGSKHRPWIVSKAGGKFLEPSHPRLLRFFREFFDYTKAPDIFKDETRHDGKHVPHDLVKDADWLVLAALKEDQQVLRQLLTTDEFFIDYMKTRAP
ncbi:MAG: DUF1592 domain-containing protein, partial [Verrucomicrobiota bacterium]